MSTTPCKKNFFEIAEECFRAAKRPGYGLSPSFKPIQVTAEQHMELHNASRSIEDKASYAYLMSALDVFRGESVEEESVDGSAHTKESVKDDSK